MIKFSIVTPTYNRAYILPNLLRSLFNQTYKNWELILVDDGSTDQTGEMIKQNFQDSRIKYFYQKNQGPSAARNLAFQKLSGEWIVYIDSDNELLSNYLDVLRINIKQNPETLFTITKGVRTLELYHHRKLVDILDDSENYPQKVTIKDIYQRQVKFDINGFAHSKEIVDAGYRWNEDMSLLEDWDFFLQFADQYQDKMLYINIPVFHYHQRFGTDGLVSNANYLDYRDAFAHIYQRHQDSPLMQGQKWYPHRIKKYEKFAKLKKKGLIKESYLRYFPDFEPNNN